MSAVQSQKDGDTDSFQGWNAYTQNRHKVYFYYKTISEMNYLFEKEKKHSGQ